MITTSLDSNVVENFSLDEIKEDVNRLDYDEQRIIINKIIEKLNPEESTLLSLFYFKENSTEEISEIMGMSKANVKVKLHRIRKRLLKEVHLLMKIEHKEVYQ